MQAGQLQALIATKKNKNKHYKYINAEASFISRVWLVRPVWHNAGQIDKLKETAKDRVELAKALIRATDKKKAPQDTSKKSGGKKAKDKSKSDATGV